MQQQNKGHTRIGHIQQPIVHSLRGAMRVSKNVAGLWRMQEREFCAHSPGVIAGDLGGLGLLARLTSGAVDEVGTEAQSVGRSDEACVADCLANFRQLHS